MLTWTTAPIVGSLAVLIGYCVATMQCWKTWTGYVGLVLVTAITIIAGMEPVEVLFDCGMLGIGFALGRR